MAVRVRPMNARERDKHSQCVVRMQDKTTWLLQPQYLHLEEEQQLQYAHRFGFDHCFWSYDTESSTNPYADQRFVYDHIGAQMLADINRGYNCCLLAYGQTGSGKTTTVLGEPDNPGLIPRICERIFDLPPLPFSQNDDQNDNQNDQNNQNDQQHTSQERTVMVSFMQIYLEEVYDLLGTDEAHLKTPLAVREHPDAGVYVQHLKQVPVRTFEELYGIMMRGNANRITAATKMNAHSSRSHSIFSLKLQTIQYAHDVIRVGGGGGFDNNTNTIQKRPLSTVSSVVHLVDCCGSENVKDSEVQGDQFKEAVNINRSLTELGRVIRELAKRVPGKHTFVSFRNSKLTWILKDCLSGNSRLRMVCNISPSSVNYEETHNTLQWAWQAKQIVTNATINAGWNTSMKQVITQGVKEWRNCLMEWYRRQVQLDQVPNQQTSDVKHGKNHNDDHNDDQNHDHNDHNDDQNEDHNEDQNDNNHQAVLTNDSEMVHATNAGAACTKWWNVTQDFLRGLEFCTRESAEQWLSGLQQMVHQWPNAVEQLSELQRHAVLDGQLTQSIDINDHLNPVMPHSTSTSTMPSENRSQETCVAAFLVATSAVADVLQDVVIDVTSPSFDYSTTPMCGLSFETQLANRDHDCPLEAKVRVTVLDDTMVVLHNNRAVSSATFDMKDGDILRIDKRLLPHEYELRILISEVPTH